MSRSNVECKRYINSTIIIIKQEKRCAGLTNTPDFDSIMRRQSFLRKSTYPKQIYIANLLLVQKLFPQMEKNPCRIFRLKVIQMLR